MGKILYRYEIEYTSEYGSTNVYLRELKVIRETEKTYCVSRFPWGGGLRRILKNAHNTYAFDTKEKAKAHFIRRNHKRIRWYEFWQKECEAAIEIMEGMKV